MKRSQDLKLINNKSSRKYRKIKLVDDSESVSTDITNRPSNSNNMNEMLNSMSGKIMKGISKKSNQIVRNSKFLIFIKVVITQIITIFSGDDNVSIYIYILY